MTNLSMHDRMQPVPDKTSDKNQFGGNTNHGNMNTGSYSHPFIQFNSTDQPYCPFAKHLKMIHLIHVLNGYMSYSCFKKFLTVTEQAP